jgi:carbamoyl-phosphate synthase large subunit
VIKEIKRQTKELALALKVIGLVNIQFAVKDNIVYILEVNPRASRTVPFVSKAIGIPLAKLGTKVMIGKTLRQLGYTKEIVPGHYCVKESVFPFIKFQGVDTILGPEMKSTGEVMGVGDSFAEAFLKSQLAANVKLPARGKVFVSVKDADKPRAVEIAQLLADLGFTLVATRGTAAALAAAGVPVTAVNKVHEGQPHIVDMMKNDEIALVVNTVQEKRSAIRDSFQIRREALTDQIPTYTTLAGARAAAVGLAGMGELVPYSMQALHRRLG